MCEHPVTVRFKPDAAATVVRTMKAGDKVRVDFVQPNGWAAIFDMTENRRELSKAIGYVGIEPADAPGPGQGCRPAAEAHEA